MQGSFDKYYSKKLSEYSGNIKLDEIYISAQVNPTIPFRTMIL